MRSRREQRAKTRSGAKWRKGASPGAVLRSRRGLEPRREQAQHDSPAVMAANSQVRLLSPVRAVTLFNLEGTRRRRRYGGLAQLVEHLLCKQGVTGSSPVTSTTTTSSQAPYPSPPADAEGSLTPLLLLSLADPPRWAPLALRSRAKGKRKARGTTGRTAQTRANSSAG